MPIKRVGTRRNGELAVGNGLRTVYTWRDGTRIGALGSNILAGHTCTFLCDQREAELWRTGDLRAGDKVIVRYENLKVIGYATSRMRDVRRFANLRDDIYVGDPDVAAAWLVKCTEPRADGHYRARGVVKIVFTKVKMIS